MIFDCDGVLDDAVRWIVCLDRLTNNSLSQISVLCLRYRSEGEVVPVVLTCRRNFGMRMIRISRAEEVKVVIEASH